MSPSGKIGTMYCGADKGFFQDKAPQNVSGGTHLIFHASYQDHGINGDPKFSLRGQDIIVLEGK